MKKSTLLYLSASALILSVIINFDREYFTEFVVFSLIFFNSVIGA